MIRIKNIYPYTIFFICLFVILFSLNFFYKKYIYNLKIDTRYIVSATQFNSFKKKTIEKNLDRIFKRMKNKYLIEELTIKEDSQTYLQSKSQISFVLIVRKDHSQSAKDIEIELNKIYFNKINEIIKDIEDNLYLFDYYTLKNELLEKIDELDINRHDELVNSKFFKEYPPHMECTDKNDKLKCFKTYSSYYNFIDRLFKYNKNFEMIDFIKSTSNKNLLDIYFDFHKNTHLFKVLGSTRRMDLGDFSITNKSESFKDAFYREKFVIFKNSDFYKNYISFAGKSIRINYCQNLYFKCFKEISLIFNKILHEHKIENSNPYTVKLKSSKTGVLQDYILKDAPVILGLTSIMTYIFFILTNKFFRRKIK